MYISENVNKSADASSVLLNWVLKLAPTRMQLAGRIINTEKLRLGKGVTFNVKS